VSAYISKDIFYFLLEIIRQIALIFVKKKKITKALIGIHSSKG